MAPNKKDKTAEKLKEKVVEDKTFGLKNKNKSKSVQNYIKSVKAQVTGDRIKNDDELKAESREKSEKRRLEKQSKLASSLQKAQAAMKALGATGRMQVINGKAVPYTEKIDIYTDPRDARDETMDDWDQETLENVINTKHGAQVVNSTSIVCKYFLDALEKRQYGWMWVCNNGEKCQYRHALPPGYVLKEKNRESSLKVDESEENTIEAMIERRRAELPPGGTKVTYETFMEWKKKKEEEAEKIIEESRKKKEKESGSIYMSGRELFAYDPTKFDAEDALAAVDDDLQRLIIESRKIDTEMEIEAYRMATDRSEQLKSISMDPKLSDAYKGDVEIIDSKILDDLD